MENNILERVMSCHVMSLFNVPVIARLPGINQDSRNLPSANTHLMHIIRSVYGFGSPCLDNIHILLGSVSVSFTNLYIIRQAVPPVASRNFILVVYLFIFRTRINSISIIIFDVNIWLCIRIYTGNKRGGSVTTPVSQRGK